MGFFKTLEKTNCENVTENQTENNLEVRYSLPRTEIARSKEEVQIQLELPGYKKNEVEISLEKNQLTVIAKKQNFENKNELLFSEFSVRNFKRVFELSEDIETDNIDAKLENGLLQIKLNVKKPISKKISVA